MRTVEPAETEVRARRAARAIPVTRLADLTPLDSIGLPVWCAVTPLASDLTTHLGKGLTPGAARTSALMEAVERASAERAPHGTLRGSYEALRQSGLPVVDPERFTLPPDTLYRPDRAVSWSRGAVLDGGEEAWLPTDLVLCPPNEGVLHQPDTNGLASGNAWIEAVVHGLLEVVERDAFGRLVFAERFADPEDGAPAARRVDPASVPASCQPIIERIVGAGLTVEIDDLTQEIAVPVLRAVVQDGARPSPAGPRLQGHFGLGAAPSAEIALRRALTEAVQSRLASIQGARDSFNRLPPATRPPVAVPAWPAIDFAAIPSFESDDLQDDLRHVLGCLEAAGFLGAVAVDLTRADLGLPVVRVRVPGLSCFVVDRSRVGWRDLSCLL